MIKTVYLHIGIHKTASTTIQRILGENRETLRKHGFLYPEITIDGKDLYKHGVPFRSMFVPDPYKIPLYMDMGISNPSYISNLNDEFIKQLKKQSSEFEGDKIIISGEAISHFNSEEVKQLKQFLTDLIHTTVEFKVILFCRHPITWTKSQVQEYIKNGKLSLDLDEIEKQCISGQYYRNIIDIFSGVFSREKIDVFRFEDAIRHPYGPTGFLLSHIEASDELIQQLDNNVYNHSLSHEAVVLINAVNNKVPRFINDKLNPARAGYRQSLIWKLPGSKFRLPEKLNEKIWDNVHEDIRWLCNSCNLPMYQFTQSADPKNELWGEETFEHLKYVLLRLPSEFRKIILQAIEDETNASWFILPDDKKDQMLRFVKENRKTWPGLKQACLYYIINYVYNSSLLKRTYQILSRKSVSADGNA